MKHQQAKNQKVQQMRRQAEIMKRITKIMPILKKDTDWPFVTGAKVPQTNEEYKRKRKALTRLTKQAVKIMCPEHKVSVRYGSGTGSHWVNVDILMPEEQTKSFDWRTIDNVLVTLGIEYATYYTDRGFDDKHEPCLSVTTNGHTWC